MKKSEIIRNIINVMAADSDENFEELRWLFSEYNTAAMIEDAERVREEKKNGNADS